MTENFDQKNWKSPKELEPKYASMSPLLIVKQHSPTRQAYCALFDRSTKIGTDVDYHLRKIFVYGGTHKSAHGGHSNRLKMAIMKFHHY